VRQLRRFEWLTVQQLQLPTHEAERLLLRIALLYPDVSKLDSMWAGVASVLAQVIRRVSYLDQPQAGDQLQAWAEKQFDSVELRLETIAASVLNGVSLERLWNMPPEDWSVHIHAALHAATLSGMPIAEYIQGGFQALVEAIQQARSAAGGGAPPAPPGPTSPGPGVMQEYAFEWRKGSEPIIRGGVR